MILHLSHIEYTAVIAYRLNTVTMSSASFDYYSASQQIVLALLPKFTSTIGIASSAYLVSEVIRDQIGLENTNNPLKRVLACIALYDIFNSISWWLSSWALPSDDSDFILAIGTQGTCSFQGFFRQVGLGAPLNYAIMTYFLYVVVTKGPTEMSYIESIEWKVQACIGLCTVSFAMIVLLLELYNPMNQMCSINDRISTHSCSSASGEDEECTVARGENPSLFGWIFFYMHIWGAFLFVSYLNIQMRLHLIRQQQTKETIASTSTSDHSSKGDIKWLTTQASLYTIAFLISWAPSTLWSMSHWNNSNVFWIDVLAASCEPLQGLWNLLIFMRNRPESISRLEGIIGFKCISRFHDDKRKNQISVSASANNDGYGDDVIDDDDDEESSEFKLQKEMEDATTCCTTLANGSATSFHQHTDEVSAITAAATPQIEFPTELQPPTEWYRSMCQT